MSQSLGLYCSLVAVFNSRVSERYCFNVSVCVCVCVCVCAFVNSTLCGKSYVGDGHCGECLHCGENFVSPQ